MAAQTQKPKQSKSNNSGQSSTHNNSMKDANLAAETRPVPSQAEGDEETIDEDLRQKSSQS